MALHEVWSMGRTGSDEAGVDQRLEVRLRRVTASSSTGRKQCTCTCVAESHRLRDHVLFSFFHKPFTTLCLLFGNVGGVVTGLAVRVLGRYDVTAMPWE